MSQDAQYQEVAFSGYSISLDAGIAKLCGVNAAIVLNHIYYWIKFNKNNPKVHKEEKVWMFESQEKMCEYLDFLTEKEIKNAIKSLCEAGIIEKRNFNKNHFDHTNWYTLSDPYFQKMFPIVPKGPIESPPGDLQKVPQGPIYIREIKEKQKDITKAATRAREQTPLPEPNLQSAAAACEKIAELITLKNTKGQEVSITVSDLYRHFVKFPYSSSLIEKMIRILRQEKGCVSNIIKLAEKICERLYSEEEKPFTSVRSSSGFKKIEGTAVPAEEVAKIFGVKNLNAK